MKQKMAVLAMAVFASIGYTIAADTPPASPGTPVACAQMSEATPGQTVIVKCSGLPTQGIQVYFETGSEKPTKGSPASANVQDGVLKFQVPDTLAAGWYSVYVLVSENDSRLIGPLQVLGAVKVSAIYPLTNYPGNQGFRFQIIGNNFAQQKNNDVIEVLDQGFVQFPCPEDNSMTPKPSLPTTSASTDTNQPPCAKDVEVTPTMIEVIGFHPKRFYGSLKIRVRVGNGVSDVVAVTFSSATPQRIAVEAAVIFFALAFVFIRLARKGIGTCTIAGEKFGTIATLFLDRQTKSYSLSKFQVLAWTAVTVYSYIYLFLCRTLVQGDFSTLPGVAQNIPQLFFVSAGTTVAAAAVTASYGSKGAGPVKPSAADFVSTGGLVAGDRFQFFIWTLVGCLGYLSLVVQKDPFQLTELPGLPDNFLYLMGVSSAGYLGGKLVRKPGPVIKVISVAKVTQRLPGPPPVAASMTINLKGESLDPKASLKVDDETLRGDLFLISGQPDAQSQFCTEIDVSLKGADKYLEGTHILTLVNGDGQAASVSFPVDPLSIDSVPDLSTGTAPADVVVMGKNFADGMTASWTDAARAESAAAISKRQGTTQLTVRLTPGAQSGTGKLTITSAIGLKASKEVTVR
jgi:hypothetical protein